MNRSLQMPVACLVLLLSIAGAHAGSARLRVSDKPRLANTEADIQAEIQFGRDLAARILGRYPLHADRRLQRYVALVGHRLAASSGRPELAFAFAVIDSEGVNAFATPGGYIFITRGALRRMGDEAELAGVLGHEIGHVSARHMVKALDIRGGDPAAGAGLASLVGGATGSLRGALQHSLERATEILFQRGYRAAEELEADETGLLLAALNGYDAEGLGRFLQRVGSFEPGAARSATHPLHQERLEALEQGRLALRVAGDRTTAGRYAARFRDHVR